MIEVPFADACLGGRVRVLAVTPPTITLAAPCFAYLPGWRRDYWPIYRIAAEDLPDACRALPGGVRIFHIGEWQSRWIGGPDGPREIKLWAYIEAKALDRTALTVANVRCFSPPKHEVKKIRELLS